MAQAMVFRGEVELGEAGSRVVDIWRSEQAAVAFEGGRQVGVLREIELGLTDDRRLTISGVDPDSGEPVVWTGVEAERSRGRWHGSTVTWPDGSRWAQAQIVWSQYGVRVSAPGQAPRDLPGAHTEAVGTQRWIIDGATRISASIPARGCGCGGR